MHDMRENMEALQNRLIKFENYDRSSKESYRASVDPVSGYYDMIRAFKCSIPICMTMIRRVWNLFFKRELMNLT
jgi:hypothetical protein